ncbi:protein STRUBBELIG-RECEPTOR FAMILY 5-like isoform X2 [Mangifera indica]|uniref:protein STRUBBELIG-RECEPTOR FAMILY 5-like isoform X2 n=1 Tax=Mangifera indica TaxID=29780 RepID=UPI001CFB1708|nr:protein STRUBBELIG-RECEPTOR FAMILY 5-like isoform X2 [Mangifera indica]
MFYTLLVMIRFLIFSLGILATHVLSKTDPSDASALNVMFISLNSPKKLSGWKAKGGDPCGDSWKGITCSGSKVTEINLSGLGLSGQMGYQLSNLKSLTTLDMSSNNFKDSIPYQLPPKLKYLDLSKNGFSGSMPYSITQLSELKYLDLSMNKLSGELPQTFSSLSKLKKLFLQNNQFTGSINVLASLPLEKLNVENNKFTGWVPEELKDIAKTGGNNWSSGQAPPPPPGAKHVAKKSPADSSDDSSSLSSLIIAASVLGGLTLVAVLIALFTRKKSSPSSHYFDEERASQGRAFTPLASQELSKHQQSYSIDNTSDFSGNLAGKRTFYPPPPPTDFLKSFERTTSVDLKDHLADRDYIPHKDPLTDRTNSLHDNEFANRLKAKRTTSARVIVYSLTDLQTATANFATGRLLGEGTFGRVYRAKYPDGKVLAVKKIDSSLFQGNKAEKFSALVANIEKIRHMNIAVLAGHCSEQGHNLLVYEYFRNGSLHEFLHMTDDFSKPLTWNTRIRIALGTARAIEYLHDACSPSLLHKNIKSSNILLDLELNPHLSDNGFASFHEDTSKNLGVGYNAPECTRPSAYTVKSDVYSFGVVMLELLTGRMPYDSKKPKSEQCLAQWAAPQLHDINALGRMVDPALRGLYPPKALSRFADIIALCVQPEPEFRPTISEVVRALERVVQQSSSIEGESF